MNRIGRPGELKGVVLFLVSGAEGLRGFEERN